MGARRWKCGKTSKTLRTSLSRTRAGLELTIKFDSVTRYPLTKTTTMAFSSTMCQLKRTASLFAQLSLVFFSPGLFWIDRNFVRPKLCVVVSVQRTEMEDLSELAPEWFRKQRVQLFYMRPLSSKWHASDHTCVKNENRMLMMCCNVTGKFTRTCA